MTSNQMKTSQEYVHHWKNGCFVFSNQNNKFNCWNLFKRVHKENQQQFKIMTTDFTSITNDIETRINNLA